MTKYSVELSVGTVKDLKKMTPALRKYFCEQFFRLAENPYGQGKLKGSFKELWSYHCRFNSVEYRAIYHINEENKIIVIALIGSRENIYKELTRRTKL